MHPFACACLLLLLTLPVCAEAQTRAARADLALVGLEDLMKMQVVSAERKEESVINVTGAVYVITADDIRRSGVTTLPEALRLAPGVQVSRINSVKWAISIRGFAGPWANKLLVLVDGRTVYHPLFSGVTWDAEDVLLEDIDRIEVIRGPGGAVWGANAVNGVINVVTKNASATSGGLATVGTGTLDNGNGSIRYGASRGALAFRAYSQWSSHGDTLLQGKDAGDNWTSLVHGMRTDWSKDRDAITLTGTWHTDDVHPLATVSTGLHTPMVSGGDGNVSNSHVLGLWRRSTQDGGSFQLQSFASRWRRGDAGVAHDNVNTYDVDFSYHAPAAGRHDVMIGGGYRRSAISATNSFFYTMTPNVRHRALTNLFAQDEVALGPRLSATVGAKVERDTEIGWELEPTVRALWKVVPGRQHVWAAASRAVRTPTGNDRNLRINLEVAPTPAGLPLLIALVGNPDFQPERLNSIEAGYRIEFGSSLTLDTAGFFGDYDGLATTEARTPRFELEYGGPHLLLPLQFDNLLDARTRGVEVTARWMPTTRWQVDAWYSRFDVTPHLSPASSDIALTHSNGKAPHDQWQLRWTLLMSPRAEFSTSVHGVGRIADLDVPAYTRVDARLEIPMTRHASIVLAGENLQQRAHREWGGIEEGYATTRIPRSARLQLKWRF
jgi:iron complex outermembrane recepter protein